MPHKVVHGGISPARANPSLSWSAVHFLVADITNLVSTCVCGVLFRGSIYFTALGIPPTMNKGLVGGAWVPHVFAWLSSRCLS